MSNQEAIKTLYEYRHCLWDKLYEPICMAIKALEQESKTGHWDRRACKCSECGYQITFSEYTEHKYKYCPNCGCRMIVPQESEE